MGGGSTGGGTGGGSTGGGAGGGAPDAGNTTLTLVATSDDQDACFMIPGGVMPRREFLNYPDNFPAIEVGVDGESGQAAVRFPLAVPSGSTIVSATLTLHLGSGTFSTGDTIKVLLMQTADVPPFDPTHVHDAAGHVDGGLSALQVSWSIPGIGDLTSPDLSALVQEQIGRADWAPGKFIGFALLPDTLATNDWLGFEDSAAGLGHPPTLVVTFH